MPGAFCSRPSDLCVCPMVETLYMYTYRYIYIHIMLQTPHPLPCTPQPLTETPSYSIPYTPCPLLQTPITILPACLPAYVLTYLSIHPAIYLFVYTLKYTIRCSLYSLHFHILLTTSKPLLCILLLQAPLPTPRQAPLLRTSQMASIRWQLRPLKGHLGDAARGF